MMSIQMKPSPYRMQRVRHTKVSVIWREAAQEIYNDAEPDKPFTREERAALDLQTRLKYEITEDQPDLGASMWADLLGASVSEVNWYEIAEHYIAEVDKAQVQS